MSRDGKEFVCIAVAAHVINILAFGADHWPPEDVEGAAASAIAWVHDIEHTL